MKNTLNLLKKYQLEIITLANVVVSMKVERALFITWMVIIGVLKKEQMKPMELHYVRIAMIIFI